MKDRSPTSAVTTAYGVWVRNGALGTWLVPIGGRGLIAYHLIDDAWTAIASQAAKWGGMADARPRELPTVFGVWMPSVGPESSEAGGWLCPFDDDGVESAHVFLAADEGEAYLDSRRRPTGSPVFPPIPDDAFVAEFGWDRTPERGVHRASDAGEETGTS